MARLFLICNPTSLPLTLSPHTSNSFPLRPISTTASFTSSHFPNSPAALRFSGDPLKTRGRELSVVTRAGPSTGSFVLAFFLPLSLILITVFTSIRSLINSIETFLKRLLLMKLLDSQRRMKVKKILNYLK
ncbi:hypothetical protein F8388_016900 [Cannabis sativa]|uniref:Transmembrane protein n=1 Tax=Cannabis sativa TaxID=3483 RepID=A0A7J6ERS2_CANSA|nr:hypothetical protein F8388_016900 [Cannabis sativa]